MNKSRILFSAAFAFLFPVTALAIPVTFTFSTPVTSGGTPGVADGDTLTLEIVAENGGTDIFSESWYETDILSAVARVGTYEAVFNPPYYTYAPYFTTNSSGALTVARWVDIDTNNTDNLGSGSPSLYVNTLKTSQSTFIGYASYPDIYPGDPSSWTISEVPLPSALWLFGSGLLGLVGIVRRKKAA